MGSMGSQRVGHSLVTKQRQPKERDRRASLLAQCKGSACNAGDTGLVPDWGEAYVPWSN